MREILFRGKTDNKWVYGVPIYLRKEAYIVRDFCLGGSYTDDWVESETIGQYTGLTDKNGKKIFEGDILCIKSAHGPDCVVGKGIIYYDEALFQYRVREIKPCAIDIENGIAYTNCDLTHIDRFEVIGNIHDNPELLGERFMNSEKVKEIKKALEDCASNEIANKLPYIDDHKCKAVAFADILTLINELESENERLLEQRNKTYNIWVKDTEQLKDRIAELEKKNAKLLDSVETVQSNRCVYKCVLTKEHLTKFAERLKEKLKEKVNANNVDVFVECAKLSDETLKELLCEK